MNGVVVDSCLSCGGLYFDHDELRHCLSGVGESEGEFQTNVEGSHGLDKGETSLSCPGCNCALNRFQHSNELELFYNYCLSCRGIWLGKEQFELLSNVQGMHEQQKMIDRPATAKDRIFQFITSLPIEFNIRPHRRPLITKTLVAINVALHLYFWMTKNTDYYQIWGLIPDEFSGVNFELISSLFLHAGFLHLLGNMYLLYKLGDNVEDLFGHLHFLSFYLVSGFVGSLCHVLGNSESTAPMIGASGAIAGVMGAYLVCFRKAKLTFMILIFQWKVSAYAWLLVWLVLNVGAFITGGQYVAWLAHIGGFVAGFAWASLIYSRLIVRHPVLRLINHFTN